MFTNNVYICTYVSMHQPIYLIYVLLITKMKKKLNLEI